MLGLLSTLKKDYEIIMKIWGIRLVLELKVLNLTFLHLKIVFGISFVCVNIP
jgi:hypothetical protein